MLGGDGCFAQRVGNPALTKKNIKEARMKLFGVFTITASLLAVPNPAAHSVPPFSETTVVQETQTMNSLTGKTIRWKFVDGSTAGITFEHELHEDGSITWRALDGAYKGASRREKSYTAVKVGEHVWAISYLAASGHTLTVLLNLDDHRATAFGSNEKSWEMSHGTFEFIQ